MIRLDAASVLLQWATGGLFFLWVTTRHELAGAGYGWLLRVVYGLLAAGGIATATVTEVVVVRELATGGVVLAAGWALVVSVRRRHSEAPAERFPPRLDLVAPAIGSIGLIAAAVSAGGSFPLSLGRMLVGALFLGVVSDAMLLGHWYLVQPGLARGPLLELVKWFGAIWPIEVALLLVPTGMVSVLNGSIDDGYNGLLGWFWAASAVMTGVLVAVTWAALKERSYSAVMAATGLTYLAIVTAFSTDLVARALLT